MQVRRETLFDPGAALTGKETYQDAVRMEFQAEGLEAKGKLEEALQLMEKALQIRCQERTMTATMPMYLEEVCDAAERLITKSNTYGIQCFKEDNYEAATTLFEYSLEMTEDDSFPLREADDRRRYLRGVTLNNYGCMERHRGHFSDALTYMQRSMMCTGEQSPVAFLNMSAVQTQLRLCEDAVDSAMQAIRNLSSAPEDASLLAVAHHNLAMALEPLDPNRAIEEYQSALSLAQYTIGPTSETTAAIEQNMMRFLQSHHFAGMDSRCISTMRRSTKGAVCVGRVSQTQADTKSPVKQIETRQGESEDIFPHPFMSSAPDPVIRRNVTVTRIYNPPPVSRRSLSLIRAARGRGPSKSQQEHMHSQERNERSVPSKTTPPRRGVAEKDQSVRRPSRLPPVRPALSSPPEKKMYNATAPASTQKIPPARRNIQDTTARSGFSVPQVNKSSTAPGPGAFALGKRDASPKNNVLESVSKSTAKSAPEHAATYQPNRYTSETRTAKTGPTAATTKTGPAAATTKTGPAAATTKTGPAAATTKTGPTAATTKTGPTAATTKTGPTAATTKTGPTEATTKTGPTAATTKTGPTAATTKTGPTEATTKTGPTEATTKTGPTEATTKTGPTAATTKTGPTEATTKTGPTEATTKTGPTEATTKTGPTEATTKTGPTEATTKTGPTEATTKTTGDYVRRSPTATRSTGHQKPSGTEAPFVATESKSNPSPGTQTKARAFSIERARTSITATSHGKSAIDASGKASSAPRGSGNKPDMGRGHRHSVQRVSVEASSTTVKGIGGEGRGPRGQGRAISLTTYMADRLDMLVVDEEELERKHASACIIQRAYRMYRARKLLQEMRENRGANQLLREIRTKIATRKIQAWYRARLHARWGVGRRVRDWVVDTSEQNKAALRIQSVARGWLARRKYWRRKYYEDNSGNAALRVQMWWRQVLAKRKFTKLQKQHERAKALAVERERREVAATIIQSHWRARMAERATRAERLRVAEFRRKCDEARRLASARKIQIWWRLLVARAELQRLREAQAAREARLREHQRKIDAATKLQAFGRMIIARREAEPLLTTARLNAARIIRDKCTEGQAASKIQRAFRYYFARYRLKDMRWDRRQKAKEARWSAFVAVVQRVGRGYQARRQLGRLVEDMRMEAIAFNERERALQKENYADKIVSHPTRQQKPFLSSPKEYVLAFRSKPVLRAFEIVETCPVVLYEEEETSNDVNKIEDSGKATETIVRRTEVLITREEPEKKEYNVILSSDGEQVYYEMGETAEEMEVEVDAQDEYREMGDGNEEIVDVSDETEHSKEVGELHVATPLNALEKNVEEEVEEVEEVEEEAEREEEEEEEKEKEAFIKQSDIVMQSEEDNMREEKSRLTALSNAVLREEEEELRRLTALETIEEESLQMERDRLRALSNAVLREEEEELRRLSAAVKKTEEEDLATGAKGPEDIKGATEQPTSEPCAVAVVVSDAAVRRTSTSSVPSSSGSAASASLQRAESDKSMDLETALAIEREKRHQAMADEKRLRMARDAIRAKANEYCLRKIAEAETAEELKSFIPHAPLTRCRQELRTSTPTQPRTPAAALRRRQELRALNLAKKRERAALTITSSARGYLARQYFKVLQTITSEYVEYRVNMDLEEPPFLDFEVLEKYTELYQEGVGAARGIRHVVIIQSFLRAAGSKRIIERKTGLEGSPQTMTSPSTHPLQDGDSPHTVTLEGFVRIIRAKEKLAARKRMVAECLEEQRKIEAMTVLNEFARITRAKKERMSRSSLVHCKLQEEEERDAAQVQAANKVMPFLDNVVSRKELDSRKGEFAALMKLDKACNKVISFMRMCEAKNELRRRQALALEQRQMDMEFEDVLDNAAMQVQRAYRSYKARQVVKEQRDAKEKYWSTIQAQDEEITAAIAAITADTTDPVKLLASLGYHAVDDEKETYEPDEDVEELIRCVIVIQRMVRGWLARRRVRKLRGRLDAFLERQERQQEEEEHEIMTIEGDGEAEL